MIKNNLPLINSHNSWSRLEEVWLGDVYPATWYDHLSSDVRDVFYQLTEITKEDLNKIQTVLKSFDIVVQRPQYHSMINFLNHEDQLAKPQICPRDQFVVVGNRLIGCGYGGYWPAWQHVLDQYYNDSRCTVTISEDFYVNGANVVRVGQDIIIDTPIFNYANNNFLDYRVQVVNNGGHMDGCFAILKPGLILANKYFDDYERTFPGWEIIFLNNPTYWRDQKSFKNPPYYNGKFFDSSVVGSNRMFNNHVIKHAIDWVGNYTETYFELNCLVIDEHNVIMLAENEQLAADLERRGITVHWVPFRTRSFWDGGVHCLTVDIRRQSTIEDFFPDRIK
jgi:N-dimethylarginine dimethylaminohydrolase